MTSSGGRPGTMPIDAAPTSGIVGDIERADPIFIHGILPRSGTNYLCELLLLHPDFARAVKPVREDLFLDHSDHLLAFAEAVQGAWDPRWGELDAGLTGRLHAAMGEGLLSFLWADRSRRLITKSPSVRYLSRFFSFFPEARLLVLVRDGRSITQSSMDTFGWGFERSARAWADAAEEIARFRQANAQRADRWRLVRYEDLVDDLDRELSEILTFAGLDPADYDMDSARNLPVRGSSVFFGPGRSSVHWEPVRKDVTFSPIRRWESWSPRQLERFEWLAGGPLRDLGYEDQPPPRRALPQTVRHRLLDMKWATDRATRVLRTRLGLASRPLRRRLGLMR
jgi:protein-tyrosine sulfotransferase